MDLFFAVIQSCLSPCQCYFDPTVLSSCLAGSFGKGSSPNTTCSACPAGAFCATGTGMRTVNDRFVGSLELHEVYLHDLLSAVPPDAVSISCLCLCACACVCVCVRVCVCVCVCV